VRRLAAELTDDAARDDERGADASFVLPARASGGSCSAKGRILL
jgi:hypothetical protein